jgi:hypothetical protein
LLKCIAHRGEEMQLACHALCLFALTLGADSSAVYSALWPVLTPLFTDPSKPAKDRAAVTYQPRHLSTCTAAWVRTNILTQHTRTGNEGMWCIMFRS